MYWIRGIDKEWKPFVQNRVNEVRQNVHPDLWNHCPEVSNTADLPSRGVSIVELSTSLLWRTGPDWLNTDASFQSNVDASGMLTNVSHVLDHNNIYIYKQHTEVILYFSEHQYGGLISECC